MAALIAATNDASRPESAVTSVTLWLCGRRVERRRAVGTAAGGENLLTVADIRVMTTTSKSKNTNTNPIPYKARLIPAASNSDMYGILLRFRSPIILNRAASG